MDRRKFLESLGLLAAAPYVRKFFPSVDLCTAPKQFLNDFSAGFWISQEMLNDDLYFKATSGLLLPQTRIGELLISKPSQNLSKSFQQEILSLSSQHNRSKNRKLERLMTPYQEPLDIQPKILTRNCLPQDCRKPYSPKRLLDSNK